MERHGVLEASVQDAPSTLFDQAEAQGGRDEAARALDDLVGDRPPISQRR